MAGLISEEMKVSSNFFLKIFGKIRGEKISENEANISKTQAEIKVLRAEKKEAEAVRLYIMKHC